MKKPFASPETEREPTSTLPFITKDQVIIEAAI